MSGDIVIVPLQSAGILAVKGSDSREVWRSQLSTDRPAVADDERLYVMTGDVMHALLIATGEEVWRVETGTLTAPPVVQSGWVIVAVAGSIAAFRASDGTLVWRKNVGTVERRPAIDGDVLFVPVLEGSVVALNLQTGEDRWSTPLGGEPGDPLAIGGKVYVASQDKRFYAIDASDGEVEWHRRVGAGPRGRPIADDDHIYFVSLDNILRALDRGDGGEKWAKGLKYRPLEGPLRASGALVVPGAATALPVFGWRDGAQLTEIKFGSTLVGISNMLFGPWNYPLVSVVTGDLEHPWTLSFLERSTDPPALPLVELTALPGVTIPIELPR